MTPNELFAKYKVAADSVEDFLQRYYKNDRYIGRGADYAKALLSSYKNDFETIGCCWISHHDSATGAIVSYYGN